MKIDNSYLGYILSFAWLKTSYDEHDLGAQKNNSPVAVNIPPDAPPKLIPSNAFNHKVPLLSTPTDPISLTSNNPQTNNLNQMPPGIDLTNSSIAKKNVSSLRQAESNRSLEAIIHSSRGRNELEEKYFRALEKYISIVDEDPIGERNKWLNTRHCDPLILETTVKTTDFLCHNPDLLKDSYTLIHILMTLGIKDVKNQLISLNKALDSGIIPSKKHLKTALLDITANAIFPEFFKDPSDSRRSNLIKLYQDISIADNPPYGLKTPEAKQTSEEAFSVYRRGNSLRKAFSVLMYDSRRPSELLHPMLIRFGLDLAQKTSFVNSSNNNEMPGKGFQIEGLKPESLFGEDEEAKLKGEDPFKAYKEAWKYLANDFDRLKKSRFTLTRGAIIISNPKDPHFEITVGKDGRKVHYSYVVFNDHFSGKTQKHLGNESFYLVPTEVIERKTNNCLINANDYVGFSNQYSDINKSGINLNDLTLESKSIGAPVLHLGSGSILAGGLCNSFTPGEKWFFENEHSLSQQSGVYVDAWGHTHKGDITGRWSVKMTPEMDKLLVPFRKAQTEIYRTANSYQNLADLFFLSLARYHKGHTLESPPAGEDSRSYESIDQALSSFYEDTKTRAEPELTEEDDNADWWKGEHQDNVDDSPWNSRKIESIEEDNPNWWKGEGYQEDVDDSHWEKLSKDLEPINVDEDLSEIGKFKRHNPTAFRMLEEAYVWHNSLKEKNVKDKNSYPVLALGSSNDLSNIEDSPFYFDTYDRTFYFGDKKITLPEHEKGTGDNDIEFFWYQLAIPHLNDERDLRFYDRRDLKKEI